MVKVEKKFNSLSFQEEIVILDFDSLEELIEEINKIRIQYKITPEKPKNIVIKKTIKILHTDIFYPINFSNVIFEEDVSFIHTNFNNSVIFTKATFNKEATFNFSNFLGGQTFFVKTIFKSVTSFCSSKFIENISFFRAVFNDIAFFSSSKFIDISLLDFAAIFNNKVEFNFTTFNGDRISFNNAEFNKKVAFHSCNFHSPISFENTIFNNLVDFSYATFETPQQFHLTDFLGKGIFNNAEFEQETQFIYCKLESSSYMNFQDTIFNKGLDISRSNFNFGKTSFWNINVKEKGLLEDALSSEYYKNDFGNKEILPSVPKKLRESMRFIKNSFYSEGNRIEGSEFEKKELEVYRKEAANWYDKILLLLNKNSNDFGTDWTKGVKFTIIVGIITYLPIIVPFICNIYDNYSLSINKEGFYNLLKHIGIILRNFIEVINITKWTHLKFFGIEPTSWQYVWLYLGRIFIAYGIYQTIQAFRKYGKS